MCNHRLRIKVLHVRDEIIAMHVHCKTSQERKYGSQIKSEK
jgi:hypothetical protein